MAREFSVIVGIDAGRARRGAREFNAAANQVSRGSRKMERGLKSANRRAIALITTLGRIRGVATLAFSGFLGVGGIGAVIRAFSQFETAVSSVGALISAQNPRSLAANMNVLSDRAREMGAVTAFTATQAAEGMQFLTLAGFEAKEVYLAIEPALNLAAAGMLDLGTAADIVSNIMAAFNVSASETESVADALAFTAARTNTNIQQLGEAMKFVGPVAGTLGVNVEETSVALGILGNSGLQASLAGTSLRRVMSGLLNPSKEATKVFDKLGLSQEELVATLQGEQGIVNLVEMLASAGLGAAEAFTLFGQRGAPGLLSLINQKEKLRELTDALEDAEGTAARMAEIRLDNLAGDWRIALSALQELIIGISKSGFGDWLREVTQTITGLVRELAGIETPADKMTESMRSGAAAAQWLQDNLKLLKAIAIALTIYIMRNMLRALATLAINLGAAALKASVLGRGLIATRAGAVAAAAGLQTLKRALVTTGIGIGLVATGYLVDYLMSLSSANEEQKDFQETMEGFVTTGEEVALIFETMTKRQQEYEMGLQQSRISEMKAKAEELGEALLAQDQALLTLDEDTRRYTEALEAAQNVDTGNMGFSNINQNIEATQALNAARLQLNETEMAAQLDRETALRQLDNLNAKIVEQEQLSKDLAAVYNGEAKSVAELRKAREESNTARTEEAAKYEEIFGLSKDEVKVVKELIDKYDERGKTSRDLQTDLEALLAAQLANLEALELEGIAADRLQKAIDELRKKIRAFHGELTPAQKRLQKLNDELEDMNPNLTNAGQAQLQYTRAVREAAFAYIAGKISLEDYANEVEKIRQIYDQTTDSLCDANKKVRECTDDSTKQMQQLWEQAMRNIQDAFADFFRNGLSDFDNFADSLLDAFKDMISNMLAAWFASGLMNIFQGKAFGAGGNSLMSGVGSLFGGGGAGGAGGGSGGTGISGIGTAIKGMSKAFSTFAVNAAFFFEGAKQFLLGNATSTQLGAVSGYAGAGAAVAGAGLGAASGFVVDSIVGSRGKPKNTLALSAIGGAIGSIFGPIGSLIGGAIGAFASNLLGGAKKLESATLTFGASMNGLNAEVETVISKQRSFFRGRKFTTKNEAVDTGELNDALLGVVETIQGIAGALGVSADALKDFNLSKEFNIKGKSEEQILQLVEDFFNESVQGLIKTFVENTEGLSTRLKTVVMSFNGNTESMIRAFELAAAIDMTSAIDPIKTVQDAIADSNKTLGQTYAEVRDAYIELIENYDGSIQSLEELAQATSIYKQVQIALAQALITAGEEISATFQGSAQSIREQLMAEDELYELRRSQIDDLVAQAMNTTDPAELARLADEINTLGLDAWNLLDEDQKAALGEEFVNFFEGLDELFAGQIGEGLSNLDQDSSALDQEVATAMTDAAQSIIDANNEARRLYEEWRQWLIDQREMNRYGPNEMNP
jgi:TP901 family phage tail tape measure protein